MSMYKNNEKKDRSESRRYPRDIESLVQQKNKANKV